MDHLPPHNPRATGQGCQGPNRVGSQQCLNQVLPEKWGPGGKCLAFRYGIPGESSPRPTGDSPPNPKEGFCRFLLERPPQGSHLGRGNFCVPVVRVFLNNCKYWDG